MHKVYLATPYSDPDPAVMQFRHDEVCKAAGHLMSLGYCVFSPISHGHSIAAHAALPVTWDFWLGQDIQFVKWADEMYVLALDGFRQSVGVKAEMHMARALKMPIVLMRPPEEGRTHYVSEVM